MKDNEKVCRPQRYHKTHFKGNTEEKITTESLSTLLSRKELIKTYVSEMRKD